MPSQLHEALLPLFRSPTRHAAAPVLSAMAHGRDDDAGKAAQIGFAAQMASFGLDEDRSRLYFDLVMASLSDAAKKELQTMDPAKYEYQSEFAKRYISLGKEQGKAEGKAEGRAEGKAEGRVDLLKRQLALRFGALSPEALARISIATIDELDAIGERLLTAPTLDEALRPR